MRYELQHPEEDHVKAVYGFDHAIGFFVEVWVDDAPLLAYDETRSNYRHLEGALDLLAEAEFFSREDVADAHKWLRHLMLDDIPEADTRRAAEVVVNMQRAAAE